MRTLKNKAEFDFVYKNGKRHYGNFFNLYVLNLSHRTLEKKPLSPWEKKMYSRWMGASEKFFFGLSVSKKIGNSPQRNLIKRRFRTFCRKYAKHLEEMMIIFMAKEGIVELSYLQLEKEIWGYLRPKA